MRTLARSLGSGIALAACVLAGVAWLFGDGAPAVLAGLRGVLETPVSALASGLGLARDADALGRSLGPYALVLAGAGVAVGLVSWWIGRSAPAAAPAEVEGLGAGVDAPDRRTARRMEKQARALARKGHPLEAAELCFASGLLDRAAELFLEAGEPVRAAEIRHDQNRFIEAAELYLKAGDPESAGALFAAHDEPGRAAECFLAAGRKTVAAEMLEKAGEHRRAGQCYAEAGFHRNAAQAFVRAQAWAQAAAALEEVILEESTRVGTGQDPRKQKEVRKLVAQAGKLYEQAGDLERAESVLERGGCPGLAAEIALQRERFARASELFVAAREPLRAAEALERLGEPEQAARLRGEHHRDRGEDEQAAEQFERAGEHLAAGDLYRKLQQFDRAASCYEREGDSMQAAEMHRLAGDAAQAAAAYERAGRFEDAAACWKDVGDGPRRAEALVRAGRALEAGQVYQEEGLEEDAIRVLQQVQPTDPDFPTASAILGEIFRERRMHTLAIQKLRQALGERELDRDTVRATYTLATVHEANGDLQEAVDLYEKILAFDYHFEDVETRLASTREQLRDRPEVPPAAASGSGRYQIVGELGRGGMGIVYKARDTVLDRDVAYKVLPASLKENPQALKNFLREAKSAAQLNHPNIVTVYDAGEQDGAYYIAMEYVDGTTLKEIVRRKGAIAPGGVLHVLVQMCEALAYAHDKKIVHRDVKTANTMWTRDRKAKIMDFGLAKVVEEVRNHTTLVSGTPYYMSPEQTLGRNVDHRTDIYSLGVTLFELATGTLPFREGNIPYHHVHTPAPDPRERKPDLPPLLAAIIARCLRKDPAERYAGAREILAEVRAAFGQGGPGGETAAGRADRDA